MGAYRLSGKAEQRLAHIYAYSVLNFGERQADLYFMDLHGAFDLIEANPMVGQSMSARPEIRRLVHRRHTIFYTIEDPSVLILDVLGAGQDPSRHL